MVRRIRRSAKVYEAKADIARNAFLTMPRGFARTLMHERLLFYRGMAEALNERAAQRREQRRRVSAV